MSELSVREQVTAAICEVIYPGANHDLPQMTCTKAGVAADAVLAVLAESFLIDAGVPPGDVIPLGRDSAENVGWLQGWDQCRTSVLETLGIDDPAAPR